METPDTSKSSFNDPVNFEGISLSSLRTEKEHLLHASFCHSETFCLPIFEVN